MVTRRVSEAEWQYRFFLANRLVDLGFDLLDLDGFPPYPRRFLAQLDPLYFEGESAGLRNGRENDYFDLTSSGGSDPLAIRRSKR